MSRSWRHNEGSPRTVVKPDQHVIDIVWEFVRDIASLSDYGRDQYWGELWDAVGAVGDGVRHEALEDNTTELCALRAENGGMRPVIEAARRIINAADQHEDWTLHYWTLRAAVAALPKGV